jgi:carboxymethylenebutenolidase
MQITQSNVELSLPSGRPCRTYVAAPNKPGKYPGILLYSEIFQLTGPILRSANRLAGHGFVVAAPEIYASIVEPGRVIAYDDVGRIHGNFLAKSTPVADFDATAQVTFNHLASRPDVLTHALGTLGFCIGGHLALRAALDPRCKAAVCAYPTGVHSGKLGKDDDAGTLGRLAELKGELLVVFGDVDPHVPPPGRKILADALAAAGVNHHVLTLPGEHAFMRDEGPRYDPEMADRVYSEAVALFKRALS